MCKNYDEKAEGVIHINGNTLNLELYIQHLLTVLPNRFAAGVMRLDDLLPWAAGMRELCGLAT